MLPHSASSGLAPPRRRAAVLPERMSHAQTRDRASARTAADCWLSTVQCRNRPGWCGRGRRDRCRAPACPLPAWSAKERTYQPAEVFGPRRRFALAIELETAGHAVRADRAALTGRGLPSPWLCIRAFWSCACTRPSMASMAATAMIRVSRVIRLDLFRLLDMGAHVLSRIAAASRCRHSRARRQRRRRRFFPACSQDERRPVLPTQQARKKCRARAHLSWPPDCACGASSEAGQPGRLLGNSCKRC